MKVLIADDDPQLLRALRITLVAKGYEVCTASNGQEAVAAAIDEQPDVIMLDLGMPQLDGVEVIEAIRGWSETPILVVSGRTGAADKVGALDAGADDYVTKPFQIDELLARIRALGRRIPATASMVGVEFATTSVNFATRVVRRAGDEIRLTPTEWKLLELLVQGEGRVITRSELTQQIWGARYLPDSSALRFHIAQLRSKLEPHPHEPVHFITSSGGYRFEKGGG
ncbi:response regulator transcription factor [Agrococcus sp. 1P02AA]|uniref:response regulator transcription factor n=1 Tax=Agrococcus sp. 1P02AA TaxID=3132259 RepID=UPI0039A4CA31